MPKFRRKPTITEMVRYGDEETGEVTQYDRHTIEVFMGNFTGTLGVYTSWRADGELQIWDTTHREWLPVKQGEWVACDIEGGHYPIADSIVKASYDRIPDDGSPLSS